MPVNCGCVYALPMKPEWIVGRPRDAYAAGRLDDGEFAERSGAAFEATTWGSLSDLTSDLPVPGTDSRPGRSCGITSIV